jgi:DNA repair protein RadC
MTNYLSIYRVDLIKDETISFDDTEIRNPGHANAVLRSLILVKGKPDREQFVVALLDSRNKIVGPNIVSIGALTSASVHPREVLKPTILSNAHSMILAHNHPSGDI